MRKRYLLLILTLFFGLALLAVDRYTSEMSRPLNEQQSQEPDYYGQALNSRQYDENGTLSQTFTATESRHYPLTQLTRFSLPVVHVTDKDGEVWQVTAAEGTLSDQESLLRLLTDVKIQPATAGSGNDLLIRTNTLSYNTRTQIAVTDDPVTITGDQADVQATGMTLDIPRQHITFNSQVNTRYVP